MSLLSFSTGEIKPINISQYSQLGLRCILAALILLMAVPVQPIKVSHPKAFNTQSSGTAPKGLSAEAWARIQEKVYAAQYEFEPVTENGSTTFYAPNPAHQLRFAFDDGGLHITQRWTPAEEVAPWSSPDFTLNLSLSGYGYDGAVNSAPAPKLHADNNRIEYARGDLLEWYINEPRGLEQGFTLTKPPAIEGTNLSETLRFDFSVFGSLTSRIADAGSAIEFVDDSGQSLARYESLFAYDATGRTLPARFELTTSTISNSPTLQFSILVDAQDAVYPVTVDPLLINEVKKLTAGDGATGDQFGYSVAISGDTVVVGAPNDDVTANADQGSAYVFSRNQGGADNWGEVKQLIAGDGEAGDFFGASVAMAGDVIIIGAKTDIVGANNGQGSAYVFARNQGGADNWGEVKQLIASDGAEFYFFGSSVAIDGDTVIVGTPGIGTNNRQGSAYVFSRNQGGADNWGEVKKLIASDGAADDGFGNSVAVSGDVVIIGAYADDVGANENQGTAYVFTRNQGGADNWGEVKQLIASGGAAFNQFGYSVAISGNTVVVGAPDDSGRNPGPGSAYVFARNQGGADNWGEVKQLIASDGEAGDFFGNSVAVSGDIVVIGVYLDNVGANNSQGSAYVFARNEGGTDNWGEVKQLIASDGEPGDVFGGPQIAISGNIVAIGATNDDIGANFTQGSAYIFELTPDIIVVTNSNDSGPGSLRQAILDANSNPNGISPDEIHFNIPGTGVHTIQPTSPLPDITDPVIIDGYTQPGSSPNTLAVGSNAVLLIELDGSLVGNAQGLRLNGGDSTVRGLVINRFFGNLAVLISVGGNGNNVVEGNFLGIDASGNATFPAALLPTYDIAVGATSTNNRFGTNGDGLNDAGERNVIAGSLTAGIILASTNNVVAGNYIGTNAAGTAALNLGSPITSRGVMASNSGNRIGTNADGLSDDVERNVISGNSGFGVLLNSNNNVVAGNYIGTDASGTAALPNLSTGVQIASGAQNNMVGGTANGSGNVISGNDGRGILISGTVTTNNTIQGNYIGTDQTGTTGIANTVAGVEVSAQGNIIGGADAGEGNLISGNLNTGLRISGVNATANLVQGNRIGTDASGINALPNTDNGIVISTGAANNLIGGTIPGAGNLVSGNANYGIDIQGAGTSSNLIQGNIIGTNVTGTVALPNSAAGVLIREQASGNIIGGTTPEARNLISGNGTGIHIHTNTTGNLVQGNYIGTDLNGTAALPNTQNGIEIQLQATANVIGGTDAGAGNLISGNGHNGIWMHGPGTEDNRIEGNFIGVNEEGDAALANGRRGVVISDGASNNTIGGTTPAARNLISGNTSSGVHITDANTSGNLVQGNHVGTDADGALALANLEQGVEIVSGAHNNVIGGTSTGAGNLISGNGSYGIEIRGSGTTSNSVLGNIIGMNFNGTTGLPNGNSGVFVRSAASGNIIGGNIASASNLIGYNATSGVGVSGPGTTGNAVLGNNIQANGGLGIDLNNNGVTANDLDDPDTGPNNFQNFPVIAMALVNASDQLLITYSVDSLPINSAYPLRIEFFTAANGEGEKFLGSDVLAAPGPGVVNLGSSTALGVNGNDQVVATATDAGGNTSEFSAATAVTFETTIFTVTKTADTNDGTCDADCSLREAIEAANASTNGLSPDRIHFNIPGAGVQTIQPTSPLPGISDAVVIDGYTQPGASWNTLAVGNNAVLLIELDGSLAGNASGLVFTAPNSTVRGLVINRFVDFPSTLIYLFYAPSADNTIIEGNFLGTDATGTTVFPAQAPNYGVIAFSTNNRIGTNGDGANDAGERNLIAGHSTAGIVIGTLPTHNNNIVAGNYIGTNADGTAALSVSVLARGVWAGDGDGHRIGTDANGVSDALERNVISGNALVGVLLDTSSTNNVVAGNYIGTDASGTADLGNGTGVGMSSSNNLVGGTSASAGNLISGNNGIGVLIQDASATANTVQGNYIGTNASGLAPLANGTGVFISAGASGNLIGGSEPGARNIISGNNMGVEFTVPATTDNLVQGNYIGTNVDGTQSIPNNEMGVFISSGATDNVVGTNGDGVSDDAEGNLISGNGSYGVGVSNSPSNVIAGNYIGVNAIGDGAIGNGLAGISVSADNNRIGTNADGVSDEVERNLISGNNTNGGVWIFGGTGNTVAGNFIGTNADGTGAIPNTRGIWITNAISTNNTVGGTTAAARNIISGNSDGGVALTDGTSGNIVQGNFIGVDVNGASPLGNIGSGVGITNGSFNNLIGGSIAGAGNVIASNGAFGIFVIAANNNMIQGNLIGTDYTGTIALGHTGAGINLTDASTGNLIGGITPGAGNLISGNNGSQAGLWLHANSGNNIVQGNRIGTNINGTAALANSTGIYIVESDNNLIGGTAADAGNLISGNAQDGINIDDSVGTLIQGNLIGTNADGSGNLGNASSGIIIQSDSTDNTIGGFTTTPGTAPGNVISGNGVFGVWVQNTGNNQTFIRGNIIGLDAPGLGRLSNTTGGVMLEDSGAIIGGDDDDDSLLDGNVRARNIISGNLNGIILSTSGGQLDTLIQGNYIGTDITGSLPRGNNKVGVSVGSAPGSRVGGLTPGAGNVISGNETGIDILALSSQVIDGQYNAVVQGNLIGVNAAGIGALGNATGIFIYHAGSYNLIGGTALGAGNVISGNRENGIEINGRSGVTTNNTVQGNIIGMDLNGTAALPNGKAGVLIDSSSNNMIGGTARGEGNVIAHNQQEGIRVLNSLGASQNDLLRGNSIFANGDLGIDLGGDGQTDNDIGDADTGPNNLQNFPIINFAETLPGKTHVEGLIHSTVTADPATPEIFTVHFYANTSCDPSSYGEGQTYLGSVLAPTDGLGSGPFEIDLPVLPAGQSFVTATATDADGNTSEFSQCVIAGPDNTAWPFALDLTPSFLGDRAVQTQYLGKQGEARWYRFEVDPGDRLTITLTELPANYDLTVYKDIGAIYDLLSDPETPEDLLLLGAEFADSAFSPDRFTPDRFTPDRFTPDAYSAFAFSPDRFTADVFSPDRFTTDTFSPDRFTSDVFAPDRFTPDRFTPDRFTPDRFTPDRFTPDRFTPDRFTPDPEAFTNAQFRALVAVSAFEGTASEGIAVNTWANDGYYYVRVLGRNGASSIIQPFTLTVHRTATTCGGIDLASLPAGNLTAQSGTFDTVILVDSTRLTIDASLQQRLNQLAARTNGAVVNVSADARVAAANHLSDNNVTCPYAKNVVAQAIKRVVDLYRPSVKYLVIVGNDGIIPFFRQADQSLLAPESQYAPPVRDTSASQASLRNSLVLTQDPYGADLFVSYDAQALPLPDVAVGRLVETAGEIVGQIDAFLNMASTGLVPHSSLVTGYDFLEDVANEVKDELDRGIGTAGDKLIADSTLSPYATAETDPTVPIDRLPWTAAQLSQALLGQRHDLIFLAGHFSAQSTLAADYQTRLLTADIVNSPINLNGTIVFSAGCHSGYNLVDGDGVILAGQSNELDWAQAFARKQAILIAGTGYQYGDTDFIEYSERLYLEFARQLRTGTGPVSVGEALMSAKHEYLTATPVMRGIHAKAYLEATLFGLPMVKVNMPGERILPIPDSSVATATRPFTEQLDDAGDQLGLRYQDLVDLDTPTDEVIRNITNAADYTDIREASYRLGLGDGEGNNRVLTNPAEPILPLQIVNVSGPEIAGQQFVLRGVGFRAGLFSDKPNILPLTGAPATELRGVHGLFTSETFYPVRPWSVNYYDALATGGATYLYLTPAQYKSNAPDSDVGTLRVYSKMTLRLFYSANVIDEGAAAPPPAILHVLATTDGNNLNFDVGAVADPVAGVQAVWVTYSDLDHPETGWRSLDLAQTNPNDSTQWVGTQEFSSPARIRYIVQAVSGTGLVTLSTNVGAYYEADIDPGAPPPAPPPDAPPLPVTSLTLVDPPTDGIYGGTARVTAELSSDGDPVDGATVNLNFGSQVVELVSDSDGQVSHTFALNITPGEYSIRATFSGNLVYAPAEDASASFTLRKQPTRLTLSPVIDGNHASFIGTLVDAEDNPLGQHTVVFVLERTDGYTTVLAAVTKPWGDAIPNLISLPAGHYTVTAYFGQPVPNTDIDLTSQIYAPSSDTDDFDIGLVFQPGIPPSDSFNQPKGPLSSQWQYNSLGSYRIVDNQLTTISGGPLYWRATSYGSNQGVYVTFARVDPNSTHQALLLKVQGGSQPDWQEGAIAVVYDARQHVIRVETYQANKSQTWTTYENTPFTLQDGDQLGAMALANGEVRIFVNGNHIATTTLSTVDQAFFNGRSGYIGLWFKAARAAALDDFGGGTIVP